MNIMHLVNALPGVVAQGLIWGIMAIGVYITFRILDIADLTTDGAFVLGAAVSVSLAAAGHPVLAVPAAMAAGACAGFVTAFLQTKLGVPPILAGIVTNTGLYTVNLMAMGWKSNVSLLKQETVFSLFRATGLGGDWYETVLAAGITLLMGALLVSFLGTRLGLSIRATGDNRDMVRASSINPTFTTIVGLCVANAFTGLSGCLLAQSQKSVSIDIGTGMVTIALASLLIGNVFMGRRKMPLRIFGMVIGAFVFRLVYTVALRFNMPAFMLKLVSSVIVVLAIATPYFKKQLPMLRRRMAQRKEAR